MASCKTHIDSDLEKNLDRQLAFLSTSIRNAVGSYKGLGSYGALALHIDRELQKVGITLTEMHLRAIAIETLRSETEQDENK